MFHETRICKHVGTQLTSTPMQINQSIKCPFIFTGNDVRLLALVSQGATVFQWTTSWKYSVNKETEMKHGFPLCTFVSTVSRTRDVLKKARTNLEVGRKKKQYLVNVSFFSHRTRPWVKSLFCIRIVSSLLITLTCDSITSCLFGSYSSFGLTHTSLRVNTSRRTSWDFPL